MTVHCTSRAALGERGNDHRPHWVRLGGAALLLLTAAAHLAAFPDHYQATAYVGLSFLLYATAATAIAIALQRDARAGYALGALLAGSALTLYIAARTVGLPAFSEDSWVDPIGVVPVGLASVIFEAMFVALYVGGFLTRRARQLDRRASRRVARSSALPPPLLRCDRAPDAPSRPASATAGLATRRTL